MRHFLLHSIQFRAAESCSFALIKPRTFFFYFASGSTKQEFFNPKIHFAISKKASLIFWSKVTSEYVTRLYPTDETNSIFWQLHNCHDVKLNKSLTLS